MRLTTCAFVLFFATSAAAQTAIYVTSAGAVDGRTDPSKDNQDSVKDVRGALNKKVFTLVDRPEDAVIVLRIMGRDIDRRVSTGKLGSVLGGKSTDQGVKLLATLEYRGTPSDLSASVVGEQGFGVWTRAAKKIADQVEAWVKDNHIQ
jgi:hypothetical protein